jgi:hypothetical protein
VNANLQLLVDAMATPTNSFWNAGALHPDDSVAIFSKLELCRTTSLVSAAI